VDEEGTEAAAVTEIVAKCTAIMNPPKKPVYNFCCKVPFVYMICDTNGMPIFSGSVSDL
jgi:serine protease inhibitor